MNTEQKLREALLIAVDYIDMDALYTVAGGDHDTIKEALALPITPPAAPSQEPAPAVPFGDLVVGPPGTYMDVDLVDPFLDIKPGRYPIYFNAAPSQPVTLTDRQALQSQLEDYKAALTKAEHECEKLRADAERWRFIADAADHGMCGDTWRSVWKTWDGDNKASLNAAIDTVRKAIP